MTTTTENEAEIERIKRLDALAAPTTFPQEALPISQWHFTAISFTSKQTSELFCFYRRRPRMKGLYFALALMASVPSIALAEPAKIQATVSGEVLAAPDGRTLYVYDGDQIDRGQQGKSSCNKECADRWPPFKAEGGAQRAGDWSIIVREDGIRQWAYKGRPLYTWAKDVGPGQIGGNGSDGNSWHLAKP